MAQRGIASAPRNDAFVERQIPAASRTRDSRLRKAHDGRSVVGLRRADELSGRSARGAQRHLDRRRLSPTARADGGASDSDAAAHGVRLRMRPSRPNLLYGSRGDYTNLRGPRIFIRSSAPSGSRPIRSSAARAVAQSHSIPSSRASTAAPAASPSSSLSPRKRCARRSSAVQPYDWRGFFKPTRVRRYRACSSGRNHPAEDGAWYTGRTDADAEIGRLRASIGLSYSVGLALGEGGTIGGVITGSPADRGERHPARRFSL